MHPPILTPSLRDTLRLYLLGLPIWVAGFLLVTAAIRQINGEPFGWNEVQAELPLGIVTFALAGLLQFWWPRRRLQREPEELRTDEVVREKALVWWVEGGRRWSGVLVLTNQRLLLISSQIEYVTEAPLSQLEILGQTEHFMPSRRKTELRMGGREIEVIGWRPQTQVEVA